MRITTNALIRNYKTGLGQAMTNMTNAMDHVMTHRSFNSVAEDPAAAARSSQLWRKYLKNTDHLSTIKDMQNRETAQEDALMQVYNASSTIADSYSLEVLNGTNGEESRATFAAAIRGYQKTMTLSLNVTYGGDFIFAGTDGKNSPFTLSDDGTVTYRGVDVNAQKGTADYEKLKQMAGESRYVDVGFGLEIKNGSVVSSSAYDMALPGIRAIGYGVDDEGMSNNVLVLAGQMADALEADTFDADHYGNLLTKFKSLTSNLLSEVTALGVKSEFLETTKTRLDDNDINLQSEISSVEGADMAEAITTFSWAQYAYNAALKVGTNILSPSFIDFMK